MNINNNKIINVAKVTALKDYVACYLCMTLHQDSFLFITRIDVSHFPTWNAIYKCHGTKDLCSSVVKCVN